MLVLDPVYVGTRELCWLCCLCTGSTRASPFNTPPYLHASRRVHAATDLAPLLLPQCLPVVVHHAALLSAWLGCVAVTPTAVGVYLQKGGDE